MAGSIKELSSIEFYDTKLSLEARFIFIILVENNHLQVEVSKYFCRNNPSYFL